MKYSEMFSDNTNFLNTCFYITENAVKDWDISDEDKRKVVLWVAGVFDFSYKNEFLYRNLQFLDWSKETKTISVGFIQKDIELEFDSNPYKIIINLRYNADEPQKITAEFNNYVKDNYVYDNPIETKEFSNGYSLCKACAEAMYFVRKGESSEYTENDDEIEDDEDIEIKFSDVYKDIHGTASEFSDTFVNSMEKYLRKNITEKDQIPEMLKFVRSFCQSIYDRQMAGGLWKIFYNKKNKSFSFVFQYEDREDDTFEPNEYNLTVITKDWNKKDREYTIYNNTPFVLETMDCEDVGITNELSVIEEVYFDFWSACSDSIYED